MKIHCKYDKLIDPKTLKPNPENPNTHTIDDAKGIIKLIEFYGWRHAITVSNQTGLINIGHLRHMASLMAEWETVPVVYQDFRDYDEEYGFLVADNGSQEWSKMDKTKINAKVPDLGLDDLDLLGLRDFCMDPSELPAPRSKKPKICPSCGFDVNAPSE